MLWPYGVRYRWGMSLDASNFEEKIDNVAPSSAGLGLRSGQATLPLYVRVNMTKVPGYDGEVLNADSPVQPIDLLNAPQAVLGGVNTDVGDGRLNRLMPLAHPQWPFLYASAIQSVRGVGRPFKVASISPLEAQPMPAFSLYPVYEFVIQFANRAEAILPDEDIELVDFDPGWTDVDGNPATGDQTYATEWMRFTDYQVVPQNDWVTCNVGSGFVFETSGGSGDTTTDPGAGGGAVYAAMPRILLPNEVVKFTWKQVPFRYYSSANSYLRRFRGKINQFDWYDWKAGELLYMTCNPIRYTPPILQPVNWIFGTTVVEKWCDMELIFLSTRRNGVNLPTPSNANFIAAGHNLMPWQGDNQFYYVRSASTQYPTFTSFPVELLFTDPDV